MVWIAIVVVMLLLACILSGIMTLKDTMTAVMKSMEECVGTMVKITEYEDRDTQYMEEMNKCLQSVYNILAILYNRTEWCDNIDDSIQAMNGDSDNDDEEEQDDGFIDYFSGGHKNE